MSSHRDPHPKSSNKPPQNPETVYEFVRKHNEVRNNEYQLLQMLGEGGFAKCYKTRRVHDKKLFAIKAINLNQKSDSSIHDKHKPSKRPRMSTQQKAHAEANFLKTCDHPNIVRYETHFIYNNVFYIVMENCPNGSVGDMLKQRKTITEVQARYYLQQMVHGLIYLKSKKIIHRDLKPANYLLNENVELKIADFGLATEFMNGSPVFTNVCGTPNYLSPEMLLKKNYSYQVDVWSLGVALYAMLYGMPPFETKKKDAKETYEKIKNCDYSFSGHSAKISVSSDAQDLISQILVLDPSKRIPLQQIIEHPFISSFHIPQQIPYRCLKKEPDQKFLRNFDHKINQRNSHYREKTFSSKEKPSYKSTSPKPKKPLRYCPEQQKSERLSRSFTKCDKFAQNNEQSSRKASKRVKSEPRRPKAITEVLKNLPKDQMLTSSPVTSEAQISHNKYVQYPSQSNNQKVSLVQIKAQSGNTSHIYYDLPSSQAIKQELPSYEQIQCESIKHEEEKAAESNLDIPFVSFSHLMKPLSFVKGPDYEKCWEEMNMGWENTKRAVSARKSFKIDNVRETKKQKNAPVDQPHAFKDNIYTLQDFAVASQSIHAKSRKPFKIAYCLKQTQSPIAHAQPISPAHYLGIIFTDNSSIVTKLSQSQNHPKRSSIYIKNVQSIDNCTKTLFENVIDDHDLHKYVDKTDTGMWLDVNCDRFRQEVDCQMKVKLKLAQHAVGLFQNTLKKSYPQLFTQNHLNNFEQAQPADICQFKFIHTFTNRQSSLYFEVNDGSKHYLQKMPCKKNYLELFGKMCRTKIGSYRYAMYFSSKKIAFLKDQGQKNFKQMSMTELKNAQYGKGLLSSRFQKEDQSESRPLQKKIKLNEEVSRSVSSRNSSSKMTQNSKVLGNASKCENESPGDLLKKICYEFKQKAQMVYIRQRDAQRRRSEQMMGKIKGERRILDGVKQSENRFCKIEIEDGALVYKLRK